MSPINPQKGIVHRINYGLAASGTPCGPKIFGYASLITRMRDLRKVRDILCNVWRNGELFWAITTINKKFAKNLLVNLSETHGTTLAANLFASGLNKPSNAHTATDNEYAGKILLRLMKNDPRSKNALVNIAISLAGSYRTAYRFLLENTDINEFDLLKEAVGLPKDIPAGRIFKKCSVEFLCLSRGVSERKEVELWVPLYFKDAEISLTLANNNLLVLGLMEVQLSLLRLSEGAPYEFVFYKVTDEISEKFDDPRAMATAESRGATGSSRFPGEQHFRGPVHMRIYHDSDFGLLVRTTDGSTYSVGPDDFDI